MFGVPTQKYVRLPVTDHNLFFFDSETGGLDPNKASMVEMACIVTDFKGNVKDEFVKKVIPELPVDPRAAEINGYTKEAWDKEAIALSEAIPMFMERAKNSIFVSHNVPFDWGFFERAMVAHGFRWIGDYHKIDTIALSMPYYVAGKVPNVKLQTLCQYFGIDTGKAHTAMSDVRSCKELYFKLMNNYLSSIV